MGVEFFYRPSSLTSFEVLSSWMKSREESGTVAISLYRSLGDGYQVVRSRPIQCRKNSAQFPLSQNALGWCFQSLRGFSLSLRIIRRTPAMYVLRQVFPPIVDPVGLLPPFLTDQPSLALVCC